VKVARLIGSAGSGKTTALKDKMIKASDALGGDPMKIGFASFTRAARAEAVARVSKAWNVEETLLSQQGWFRTVHSTAYRCVGVQPGQIITDKVSDIEWISNALGVKLSTQLDEEAGSNRFIGDPEVAAALNCWSLARSSLTDLEEIVRRARQIDDDVPDYAKIIRVCEQYESSKRMESRLDFSDLLLMFAGISADPRHGMGTDNPIGELPPVEAWLFDEQQDASPLLDACCKRLVSAPSVKWCYVVGDPFQAIYGFAGSSAECFLGWQADKEEIMPKSYRCPKPVLELGERCLRRMLKGYFDRNVAAADHDGTVNEASDIDELVSQVDPNDEWLLIARTNYQAARFHAAMQSAGKPCCWTHRQDGLSARDEGMMALWSLEKGEAITGNAWKRAIEILPQRNKDKKTILERGTKTQWKGGDMAKQWDVLFKDDLDKVGATEELTTAIQTGNWVSLVDRGQSWRTLAERWGPSLVSEPRVRVGTIHSVKGAEADNVALLTTTSKKVVAGSEDVMQHDEECRIAYVGVTRARRNLHIVNEGGPRTPRMEVL